MDFLQNLIHRLEVGSGKRYIRTGLSVLVVVALLAGYDWRAFKNMSTQEAMDAAQVARNLAQGRGFTTLFVRPFSMHLLTKHCLDSQGIPTLGQEVDQAQIKGMHPDLANPPVYPVVLAGLMKVLPFNFVIPESPRPFWSINGQFRRHEPDFLIALFNQLLFLSVAGLVFLLARRLFNNRVAWISSILLLGTEQLWRFSVSGLPTMLLLLIFTGLVWSLVLLESETREPKWGSAGLFLLPGLAGLFVGLGCLTRYSFAWLIIPVLLFIFLIAGKQMVSMALTAFLAFAVVITPWVVRNYSLSSTPFGTAGYAVFEGSYAFPEHHLQRSLDPDFNQANIITIMKNKLLSNSGRIVQNDLPKLGGSWLAAFFLVGLLLSFDHPSVRVLRYFLVAALLLLAVTQALVRTQLSDDSPEINSENLLVLLVPFVIMYGVSFFSLLFDQIEFPIRELRYIGLFLFGAIACLPLILTLLTPAMPLAFPPYYPPAIQSAAGYAKQDELTMSDVPWAMAWYGQAQCVWLTLSPQSDFFAINDDRKAIQALYLAQPKTDTPSMIRFWMREPTWDGLLFQIVQASPNVLPALQRNNWPIPVDLIVPQSNGSRTSFPLQNLQRGWPGMLLLTARFKPPQSP